MATAPVVGIDASRISVGQRTGTENYSLQITKALLAGEAPWQWRLYTNALAADFPIELTSRSDVRSIPSPRLWTHYRLSREMLRHRPDVLFVPAHVVPLVHPPTVVTIHDLGYLHVPDAHPARQRRMLDLTTRWSARVARQIIVPSGRTRDDLVAHYGTPGAKITVVHHGIDERFFLDVPAPDASFRDRYGLRRPYVLAVGTIQPRKDYPTLARAMRDAGPDHDLVIAGKRGWMANDVLAELNDCGLGERLRILDYVPDPDLPALYAGGDLFVQPSAFEGFGMPVLEAMAVGTPVVSATGSSLSEIGGDAADWFDPGDADSLASTMQRILGESATRDAMSTRGRAWASGFTWERAAQKTRMIIESILT